MSFDSQEQRTSSRLLIGLAVLFALLIIGLILILPESSATLAEFQEGIGFKTSAIYAFFTTIILLIVLAIAGGDGLIGELQYLLIGFFGFFIIIWLFIAWIF